MLINNLQNQVFSNKHNTSRAPIKRNTNNVISFKSDLFELRKKIPSNNSKHAEIARLNKSMRECEEAIANGRVPKKVKETLLSFFADVSTYMDTVAHWNSSIQEAGIFTWDYMSRRGPQIINNSNSFNPDEPPKTTSMIVIDVDNLKQINSQAGTVLAGNEVVHHVARSLKKVFPHNIVTKFGGDEFFILMSNTPKEEAVKKVQEFNQLIKEDFPSYDNKGIPYTVSAGIAVHEGRICSETDDKEMLKEQAEKDFARMTRVAVFACSSHAKNSKFKGSENGNIIVQGADKDDYTQVFFG